MWFAGKCGWSVTVLVSTLVSPPRSLVRAFLHLDREMSALWKQNHEGFRQESMWPFNRKRSGGINTRDLWSFMNSVCVRPGAHHHRPCKILSAVSTMLWERTDPLLSSSLLNCKVAGMDWSGRKAKRRVRGKLRSAAADRKEVLRNEHRHLVPEMNDRMALSADGRKSEKAERKKKKSA